MDGNRLNYLNKFVKSFEKNGKIILAVSILVFAFSAFSTGYVYKLPIIGPKLLANSIERQANSPQATEQNKLRLKAISDALESGKNEYTYEVPALLGPGSR